MQILLIILLVLQRFIPDGQPAPDPIPTPRPEFHCFYVIEDGKKRLVCE